MFNLKKKTDRERRSQKQQNKNENDRAYLCTAIICEGGKLMKMLFVEDELVKWGISR